MLSNQVPDTRIASPFSTYATKVRMVSTNNYIFRPAEEQPLLHWTCGHFHFFSDPNAIIDIIENEIHHGDYLTQGGITSIQWYDTRQGVHRLFSAASTSD